MKGLDPGCKLHLCPSIASDLPGQQKLCPPAKAGPRASPSSALPSRPVAADSGRSAGCSSPASRRRGGPAESTGAPARLCCCSCRCCSCRCSCCCCCRRSCQGATPGGRAAAVLPALLPMCWIKVPGCSRGWVVTVSQMREGRRRAASLARTAGAAAGATEAAPPPPPPQPPSPRAPFAAAIPTAADVTTRSYEVRWGAGGAGGRRCRRDGGARRPVRAQWCSPVQVSSGPLHAAGASVRHYSSEL
jgi:hypothetical protein